MNNIENDKENDNIDNIIKWQNKMMKKHGYYTHGVILDNTRYQNFHTHGLMTSFDIPNLQIVIPMSPELVNIIFRSVIKAIQKDGGIPISIPGPSDPFLLNLINGDRILVRFSWADEMDSRVLRIILSDPNLRFKDDSGCDPFYSGQEDINVDTPNDNSDEKFLFKPDPNYDPYYANQATVDTSGKIEHNDLGNSLIKGRFSYENRLGFREYGRDSYHS